MSAIILRTIFFYFFVIFIMKIMGKRQIGQLQLSEFVISLMLSEIAADPVTNTSKPILYAVIPILLLLGLEILISFLTTKTPAFKKLFDGVPSYIVVGGELDQRQLRKNRISLDELLSEMRKKDVYDIADVEYAILEQSGQLSVTPKFRELPLTKGDYNIIGKETGIAHPLVVDGHIRDYNLDLLNKDHKWLHKTLKGLGTDYKKVFLFTVDDEGKQNLILKEKK